MSSPSVTREDLAAHFHLPISDAARRLNICTTVMKKICRQHGIARWPQRKVAALRKRIKALEYELAMSAAPEKKAGIAEQLRFLSDELAAILDGSAPCLSNADEMDSEPTTPNASGNRKRKHGFEGPTLKLDRMEIETDESGQDLSPATAFTPRNPFPQNSPRYRLENNRFGLPSPHSREDSSEFIDESPRSDVSVSSSRETTPRQSLPSMPQDDAMSMLLEAITSVEMEAPAKKMRFGSDVSLPPLASLRTVMHLDPPPLPYAAYPFYDYTPRPSQPTPHSAYPTLYASMMPSSAPNPVFGTAMSPMHFNGFANPQPQFRF